MRVCAPARAVDTRLYMPYLGSNSKGLKDNKSSPTRWINPEYYGIMCHRKTEGKALREKTEKKGKQR